MFYLRTDEKSNANFAFDFSSDCWSSIPGTYYAENLVYQVTTIAKEAGLIPMLYTDADYPYLLFSIPKALLNLKKQSDIVLGYQQMI